MKPKRTYTYRHAITRQTVTDRLAKGEIMIRSYPWVLTERWSLETEWMWEIEMPNLTPEFSPIPEPYRQRMANSTA